ncbi:MAG: Holliday junction resolvase RuvX [Anaerolineae bacterium]
MRYLALDVGERRVGLATSDSGIFAAPHGVLHRKSKKEDFARIQRLVSELKIDCVVVGVPYSLNADEPLGPQARRVLRYARALSEVITAPVTTFDERYSTVDAGNFLSQSGGKTPIDAAAAAVILQNYLDSLARPGE